MEQLARLPIEIQAMLVAGYLAYHISIVGMDRHIKLNDQVFQILVFGLTGWLIGGKIVEKFEHNTIILSIAIILTALFFAIIWRGYARNVVYMTLRKLKIHSANPYGNTLETIIHGYPSKPWRYIEVYLKDGSWYKSDLAKVRETNTPTANILIDETGNIGLYVTNHCKRKDDPKEQQILNDGTFELTYIPQDQIKILDIGIRN